jgi:hypothetical protein
MTLSFVFGFIALVLIFDVFTTFELWRFISANRASSRMVAEYLFYLLPLVSVELFPGSVLVASLMTYALIAKRREAVAWWSSGQSVYRLMVPGFAFAILVAGGSWFIQERIMPQSNVRQDALRARIRGNIAQMSAGVDRRWLVSADGSRIYSYDFDDRRQVLIKPAIYEFDGEQIELKRVINGEEGKWLPGNQFEISKAQWITWGQVTVAREAADTLQISNVDPPVAFKPTVDRPSQFNASGLRTYVQGFKGPRCRHRESHCGLAAQIRFAIYSAGDGPHRDASGDRIRSQEHRHRLVFSCGSESRVLVNLQRLPTTRRAFIVAATCRRLDADSDVRLRRAVFYFARQDVRWKRLVLRF